jgi:hypothetical protein
LVVKKLPVKSKIIAAVYFRQEDGRLRLCFQNGQQREFLGVPEPEVRALITAPSPGHHYISHIRSRFPKIAA